MKKHAGYLIFAAYLSFAGILCLYISMPATSSHGPHILCGGHHQDVSVSPRDVRPNPVILPRPIDAFCKPYPQESDEGGSSKSARIVYC